MENRRCPPPGILRTSAPSRNQASGPRLFSAAATLAENETMRTLMLLGLIVGGLVVAGAIHITQSNGNIEISVDKSKVEAVTGQVIREGQTIIRNAQNQPATAAPQAR